MSLTRLRLAKTLLLLAALMVVHGILPARAADSPAASTTPVLTWGDQGDGTYRNPILNADYSDPDVIRVGEDFYLVGSDFHFVGIQVLHSRDLVNLGDHRPGLQPADDERALRQYARICAGHLGAFTSLP
jgi:hypothetical protein